MQFLFLFITILQQCDKILNEKRSDTRELAEQNTKYNRMGSKLFFKKAALKTRLFFFILIPSIQLQVFNACRLGWCGNFLFSLIAVGRCSISLSLFEWGGDQISNSWGFFLQWRWLYRTTTVPTTCYWFIQFWNWQVYCI